MASRVKSHSAVQRPKFTELNNLCSQELGTKILFATDDWFAAAENLLKDSDAEWKEGVFDNCGKWMDGWETRRKRIPGHDFCIIKLGQSGLIHGVDIDTSFFTGNFSPKASVQAACLSSAEENLIPVRLVTGNGKAATDEEMKLVSKINSEKWETIVPKTVMGAGYSDTCHNYLEVKSNKVWTHLRLNMFPDGGIARLRVYGQVRRDMADIVRQNSNENGLVDLVAMTNGGVCIGYSDAHYGHPRNIILKGSPVNMEGGWETARRLDRPEILTADKTGVLQVPGFEWAAFRLGVPGTINKIEVDTMHFKGNFPDSCRIEACCLTPNDSEDKVVQSQGKPWTTLLVPKKMGANKMHTFEGDQIASLGVVTHVRVSIAPDGGLARIRLWGKP
jgi:allantoicase